MAHIRSMAYVVFYDIYISMSVAIVYLELVEAQHYSMVVCLSVQTYMALVWAIYISMAHILLNQTQWTHH